jgi:glycosyltransferase involved in cell wall biosynthesis
MHILFLGNGGSPNTVNWVRYYSEVLGHRITLLSFDPVPETIPGVELLDFSWELKLKFFYRIPLVRRMIRTLKPDLVLAYRLTSYGFTAACSGFHPLVIAAQGLQNLTPVKRITASFSIKRADLLHAWGENLSERLVMLGANPAKILTIPRGVDTNLFHSSPRRSNGPVRILSTRSLVPYYRTDVIIRAFAGLFRSDPTAECRLVGDGSDKPNLERLAENLGIRERISFPGRIGYSEIADELRSADIYVSAVPTDGVSSSLLEAMACGVFPVVVDNPANRCWIKHGENGFLYHAGEVEQLARLLETAAADPGLRETASRQNIDLIRKRADWKTNMNVMEKRHLELVRFYWGSK